MRGQCDRAYCFKRGIGWSRSRHWHCRRSASRCAVRSYWCRHGRGNRNRHYARERDIHRHGSCYGFGACRNPSWRFLIGYRKQRGERDGRHIRPCAVCIWIVAWHRSRHGQRQCEIQCSCRIVRHRGGQRNCIGTHPCICRRARHRHGSRYGRHEAHAVFDDIQSVDDCAGTGPGHDCADAGQSHVVRTARPADERTGTRSNNDCSIRNLHATRKRQA